MENNRTNSSFFFLIVDDGGFNRTWPDNKGEYIDFSAYKNLIRLAQSFDIQIVLSCTTKFIDIKQISTNPATHKDSKRFIRLIEKNSDRLLLADHGYNHQFGDSYCEFHNHRTSCSPSQNEQAFHIEQSVKIYQSLGWPLPKIFIPPAHGWEPGVTDSLYAKYGFKYLSSVLRIKKPFSTKEILYNLFSPTHFSSLLTYPNKSQFLTILPRLGLGIPHHLLHIYPFHWLRAYLSVLPTSPWGAILCHRHHPCQPHNYMAHIANFSYEKNYRNWSIFFNKLLSQKCYLAKTFKESLHLWEKSHVEINK